MGDEDSQNRIAYTCSYIKVQRLYRSYISTLASWWIALPGLCEVWLGLSWPQRLAFMHSEFHSCSPHGPAHGPAHGPGPMVPPMGLAPWPPGPMGSAPGALYMAHGPSGSVFCSWQVQGREREG